MKTRSQPADPATADSENIITLSVGITVSLGAAQLSGNESIDAFFSRADAALYTSKDNGRNRVTVV